MNQPQQPEIYFHVGLGKVASTYLQYRFFPKLLNVHYIQRTRYKKAQSIIEKTNHAKYLVSREFDRQLEQEVARFAQDFPNARPILLLRRHEEWIASQYRRKVKNGESRPLEEFLDLTNDRGRWQIRDLYLMPKVRALEQAFSHKPLVLFHDDLKNAPFAFFDALADYMGATYNLDAISMKPFHASYSHKQLKVMRKWGSRVFNKKRQLPQQAVAKWFKRRSEMLVSYLILYSALLMPDAWVRNETLYSQAYLNKIREYYQDDWEQCVQYARANNPEEVKAIIGEGSL
jgi:hypothetical protein